MANRKDDIIAEVERLEAMRTRIVQGASRGGSSTSEAKRAAGRANAARARAAREMYRKFPILRKERE